MAPKIITVHKHFYPLEKSLPRKFQDTVLQDIQDLLDNMFLLMQDDLIADVIESIRPEKIQKSLGEQRAKHKYIKRTGPPGHYRYWYKDEKSGKLFSSDKPIRPDKHSNDIHKDKPQVLTVAQHSENISHKLSKVAKKLGINEAIDPDTLLGQAKPSTVKYQSPQLQNSPNLVMSTHFGAVDEDTQTFLNKGIQNAEIVLSSMNIKFKTPISFFCTPMDKKGELNAVYINETSPEFVHAVGILKEENISNSLMHEIGHAIDMSMSSSIVPRSEEMSKFITGSTKLFKELEKTIKSSPYYKIAKQNKRDFKYLTDKSEMFARAFEIYSYSKAEELVKVGKLEESFLSDFYPDLYRTGLARTAKLEETPEYNDFVKKNDEFNNQVKELMIARNKTEDKDSVNAQIHKLQRQQRLEAKKMSRKKASMSSVPVSINEQTKQEITNKIVDLMGKILSIEEIQKSMEKVGLEYVNS